MTSTPSATAQENSDPEEAASTRRNWRNQNLLPVLKVAAPDQAYESRSGLQPTGAHKLHHTRRNKISNASRQFANLSTLQDDGFVALSWRSKFLFFQLGTISAAPGKLRCGAMISR